MTSLHTKFRPTTLDGVLGQGGITRGLKRVIQEGRTHTFLMTGPPGVGKTSLCRIVAHAVGAATGLIEVDAATNSGADAMREVISKTFFRAVGSSPIKAVIVDECHRLSAAAWTILLKPIEEPPAHVYWFFATTDPGKIPNTILTRCLRFDLKPVDEVTLFELLLKVGAAEGIEISDEVLEAIAEGSGGSPRQSLVYLEACQGAITANDARQIMRTAAQAKEPVDLARLLIAKRGVTWQAAVKIINSMEGYEAESIRIVVCTYIAGALAKAKSEDEARNLLRVLDCFSQTYQSSDKLAPLFLSVGLAFGLDQ